VLQNKISDPACTTSLGKSVQRENVCSSGQMVKCNDQMNYKNNYLCFDLLSYSLNLFFKIMHGDQSLEYCIWIWGSIKGFGDQKRQT